MNFEEFRKLARNSFSIRQAADPSEFKESDWHQHPNGGGWVENTARVDPTAYIGEYSMVGGNAQVLENARVGDIIGKVSRLTVIRDNAIVKGNTRVTQGSLIEDNTIISDNAKVCTSMISDNAHIAENAELFGADIANSAVVAGKALVSYGTVLDTSRVDGNAIVTDLVNGNQHIKDNEIIGDTKELEGCGGAAISLNLPPSKTLLAQHGIAHKAIGGATNPEKAPSSADIYKVAIAAKGPQGLS